jgi:hypothetical protein
MMTKLYHPTLPGVAVQVDDKDLVDRHVAAGWKKTEPKAAREAAEASE